MWLNITTRVRGVIASANSLTMPSGPSGERRPQGQFLHHHAVALARSRQPPMPPLCSWSVVTTSSPAARSSPFARKLIPIVAFCVIAISSTGALMNAPSFVRDVDELLVAGQRLTVGLEVRPVGKVALEASAVRRRARSPRRAATRRACRCCSR